MIDNNSEIHWMDLDETLWSSGAKWWIVDKNNPSKPLLRVSQYDGNLILSGFFKGEEFPIYYNGLNGWLSIDMWNKIQRIKKLKVTDIGISWREFADVDQISEQAKDLVIHIHRIKHLENSKSIINLLTARNNKNVHISLIEKLNSELVKLNITINEVIFVNDPTCVTFYGTTSEKKMLCILEAIVGHKIEDKAFVPILVNKYDISYFYDDDETNIEHCRVINRYLKEFLDKTQPWLKQQITENLHTRKPKLFLNKVNTNELNPFDIEEILIEI